MTTLAQNVSWFLQGWTGIIPVWNKAGVQVGYRKSYDDLTIYWYPGHANIAAGTELITKNFIGQDIPLTVAAAKPATATTPAGATATLPANLPTQPQSSGTTPDLLGVMQREVDLAGVKVPVWGIIAAGAGTYVVLRMTAK